MSKILLRSRKFTKNEYADQTITFPIIGKATFNGSSVLEVDEDKIKEFIELTQSSFDFYELDKTGKEIKTPEKQASDDAASAILADLDSLTTTELLILARDSKVDGDIAGMTDAVIKKKLLVKLLAATKIDGAVVPLKYAGKKRGRKPKATVV